MDAIMTYELDGQVYEVEIIYKRIRNIHFRFDNGKFIISCPKRTPERMIKSGLDKYARKLRDRSPKTQALGDDFIYLFGQKVMVSFPGEIMLDAETKIHFKDINDLLKKCRQYFLNYVTSRTNFYAERMNAPHYLVKVRQMKSRYGSNNRHAKTITYSLTLIHYSPEIIDSVVVHELAHCFAYNHGDNFYRIVYNYCPRYDEFRKKLIKAVFA